MDNNQYLGYVQMVQEEMILITGDSFAADWTVKNNQLGWVNYIDDTYNIAQAGVGQYKILKQLQSQDLSLYTHIIVSHTSPYRIHTLNNPLHVDDNLHSACDFIYEDVASRLPDVEKFFTDYFDLEYALYVHSKICEEIDQITQQYSTLHISHIDWKDLYRFENQLDFNKVKKDINNSNHYNDRNNKLVYNEVMKRISQ